MELIPAKFYQDIYLILVTILSLTCFKKYAGYGEGRLYNSGQESNSSVILLTLFVVLFIGFRPVNGFYFVDMKGYEQFYMMNYGSSFQWTWDTNNIIFDNLILWMASMRFDIYAFFVLMATIYFFGIAIACAMLFPKDKLATFLLYLAAFSTFSYATNGIKAGAAASFFIMALAFDERANKIWTVIFLLLSLGFHHSMQLPVIAFVVCKIVKDPKYYFGLWMFCLLMSVAHVTLFMHIFERWTDEQGSMYLSGVGDTFKGFRLDFVLYSAVPIVIGQIALRKKMIISKKYEFLLNLYTLTNSIWLLCMYAEFNNRISYLSWFMLPIVLVYPFLKERWGDNQYVVFKSVANYHLLFTLFMMYIYYGFIHSLIR